MKKARHHSLMLTEGTDVSARAAHVVRDKHDILLHFCHVFGYVCVRFVCVCLCVCMCACACVCARSCACECTHVNTYTQTHKQTDTHRTHRGAERWRSVHRSSCAHALCVCVCVSERAREREKERERPRECKRERAYVCIKGTFLCIHIVCVCTLSVYAHCKQTETQKQT
jgi:hypothetical protein